MESGFSSWKDVLDVVAIPFALALLTLLWPAIQSWYRCRRFRLLTKRELEEISPFPEQAGHGTWKDHLRKRFLHKDILYETSQNRDFLLSLDPDFVYYLAQLWVAYEVGDPTQWLHFLRSLATHSYNVSRRAQISAAADSWEQLLAAYDTQARHPASHPLPNGSI